MPTNHWSRLIPKKVMNRVLYAVFEVTDAKPEDIRGRVRTSKTSKARHIAMWVLMRHLGYSSNQVAITMSRDHTTVLHGVKAIDGIIADGRDQRGTIGKVQAIVDVSQANCFENRLVA